MVMSWKSKQERMEEMVVEAKEKGLFVRVFDIRYATEGIPEVCQDHVYFPRGSYEVSATGKLNKASSVSTKLDNPKVVLWDSIILFELSIAH